MFIYGGQGSAGEQVLLLFTHEPPVRGGGGCRERDRGGEKKGSERQTMREGETEGVQGRGRERDRGKTGREGREGERERQGKDGEGGYKRERGGRQGEVETGERMKKSDRDRDKRGKETGRDRGV